MIKQVSEAIVSKQEPLIPREPVTVLPPPPDNHILEPVEQEKLIGLNEMNDFEPSWDN